MPRTLRCIACGAVFRLTSKSASVRVFVSSHFIFTPPEEADIRSQIALLSTVVLLLTLSLGLGKNDLQTAEVPPVKLSMPAVHYPEAARLRDVEGEVRVQGLVGLDSLVHETRVTKSVPGLDQEAVRVLKGSKFVPALDRHGKPVDAWVEVPVRFMLR